MELKELINGQTLRFDGHKRGGGEPVKWDDTIHLHKKMRKTAKNQGAQISVYLNREFEPVFKPKKIDPKVKKHLLSEIKNALQENDKIDSLVRAIIDLWKRCNEIEYPCDSKSLDKLDNAIINLAKNFGCNKIVSKFLKSKDAWFEASEEDAGKKTYIVVNKSNDIYVGANKRELTRRITSDKKQKQ